MGQVFDSPVDYEGIPHGLPVATTDNVVLQVCGQRSLCVSLSGFLTFFFSNQRASAPQKAMEASIRAFLSMAKSTSAKHRAASALFHNTRTHFF